MKHVGLTEENDSVRNETFVLKVGSGLEKFVEELTDGVEVFSCGEFVDGA